MKDFNLGIVIVLVILILGFFFFKYYRIDLLIHKNTSFESLVLKNASSINISTPLIEIPPVNSSHILSRNFTSNILEYP